MSRYIDADALIIDLQIDIDESDMPEEWFKGAKSMLSRVKDFPATDVVEVKHGKWIPRTNLPKQEIFICSVCDGWAYSPWIGNRKNPKPNWCKYKYCPNCGAKMEVIK